MSEAKPTSDAMEQLTAIKLRVSEIEKEFEQIRTGSNIHDWDQIPRLRVELEGNLREAVSLARTAGDLNELELQLANLCHVIAEKSPQDALGLAKEFDELPIEHEDWITAAVSDARNIAYLGLGEAIRATQQRKIASGLRRGIVERTSEDAGELKWQELMAALRSQHTQLAGNEKYVIDLPGPLGPWLSAKSRISLFDLAPSFGKFVSNDRQFYREATSRVEMLAKRIQARLSKPDNYLLLADPGSGKSFFVKQFTEQLKNRLNENVTFLERNLSAYSGIDLAFTDIVTDVLIALTAHQTVLLFIDEVDTQLDERHMFQRLIAPMNGDPFFLLQKQMSFAKQNLVVFFALSSKPEDMKGKQKWPDFLSRIPPAHQIRLPEFKHPLDRIYRAVAMLPAGVFPVARVQATALLYIGLRPWTSVRELEQALELAKMRTLASSSEVLELADIALSTQDVEDVEKATTTDIFGGPTNVLEVS
jgi:hypothetical protein